MGFRAVATKKKPENATEDLFADYPEPERRRSTASFEPLRVHIWSETKAQLIRNYLEYFGWVTRHGCYIDGFAGPQNPEERDGWSAYLALSIRPTFIRNFHLCERNRNSFQLLTQLRNAQPSTKGRTINLYRGDFNRQVHSILEAGHLTNTNATFALLDQRTFQCHWRTVTALASRKGGRYKIELFYFFPTGWLNRSLSRKRPSDITDWWGNDSWQHLTNIKPIEAMFELKQRLQDLGYIDVQAWPINERKEGDGRVMYHMLHATDHELAPKLMEKAYHKLVATATHRHAIEMWERQHLLFDDNGSKLNGD